MNLETGIEIDSSKYDQTFLLDVSSLKMTAILNCRPSKIKNSNGRRSGCFNGWRIRLSSHIIHSQSNSLQSTSKILCVKNCIDLAKKTKSTKTW